jgi:arylsulfatase A-like enzyme
MDKLPPQVGSAPRPAPELARVVMLTALAAGVLAGLAEAGWAYLLPIINAQWRAVLPASLGGLAVFAAAAVATDVLLALAAGLVLLLLLALLTRVTRVSGASPRLHLLARAVIFGGTLCYLYVGWIVLFVLLAGQRQTLAYRAIVGGGAAVLLLIALLVSLALTALERRGRQHAMMVTWCVLAGLLVIALGPAWWRYRVSQPAAASIAVSAGGPRPNVLLVTLDTVRLDYLGCYGHAWIQTPAVDELAAHGVVFDAAIAQAPSTAPSHCSIMTSVYPFDHGAENGKPMARGLVTLADVLRANGYETVAFVSSTTTRSINSGLQQGFERYVDSLVPWAELFGCDEFQHLIFFYVVGILEHSQIPGKVVSDRALRWLAQRSDRPFFAWLHYFDPHLPYGSPPPARGMYTGKITDGLPMAAERERYAEDITYADLQFGRFLAALREQHLYDDTLIIVASDHGEAFGEQHGDVIEKAHGRYLYDTTQRVPLIIKPAGARLWARRVAEQVELTDIAPTILDLLGIEIPGGFRGKPLAELLEAGPFSYAGRDAHAFNVIDVVPAQAGRHQVAFVQQLAVRSPQWKFITRPRAAEEELYNLVEDPSERSNLVGADPQAAAERRARILPYWDPQRDTSEDPRQRLAPSLVRELQALGYLGGGDDDETDDTED